MVNTSQQRSCSCAGFNEHCYRCGGRGWYSAESLQNLVTFPQTPPRSKPKQPSRYFTQAKYPQAPNRTFTQHAKERTRAPYPPINLPNTCSYCGCRVKKNMFRHQSKRCPMRPSLTKTWRSEKPKVWSQTSRPTCSLPTTRPANLPDTLDATHKLGWYARENGRFGSPCSYDRFDGDSHP